MQLPIVTQRPCNRVAGGGRAARAREGLACLALEVCGYTASTVADLLGGVYVERGLAVVRARAFNHTGAGQEDRFVLASFARQAAEIAAGLRDAVIRVGNLDSCRDFLDVEDVVAAYLALAAPEVFPGAYKPAVYPDSPLVSHHPPRLTGLPSL